MVNGPSSTPDDARRFATDLTAARARAGLTIRDLHATTRIPTGTLGGYFSGRHLPPANRPEVLEEVLAACGVPEDERDAWHRRLQELHLERRSPKVTEAPYRGLDPYGPGDADIFFGREDERLRLVSLVLEAAASDLPVVCVVGPSGVGKTSLLLAGLVATLAGADPAWAWIRYDVDASAADEPLPLVPTAPTLVVADQLESVVVPDHPEATDRLLRLLDWAQARQEGEPPRAVALALRADLYPLALHWPRLRRVLQERQVVLARMSLDDLRAVVEEPARARGLGLEEGLVDLVVTEAGHEPERALPHLSYLLARMFAASDHRTLRVADYLSLGGFTGAIRVAAEEAYAELDPAGQDLARRLLLRMVTYRPDAGPVRRRLATQDPEDVRVLSHFTRRRLLTLTETGYELSHEALLRGWPRLAEWIEQDRHRLTVADGLARAAAEWEEAGRDPAHLLRGARLAATRELLEHEPLPEPQADLLASSVVAAGQEQRRERLRLRRARQVVAALAALVLLAGVLLVDAQRSRQHAVDARAAAESREIAGYAGTLLSTNLPVSSYLSIAALQRAENRTSRSAVVAATGQPMLSRYDVGVHPNRVAVWDDGQHAAIGSLQGDLALLAVGGDAPEERHLRPPRTPVQTDEEETDDEDEGQIADASPPVVLALAASADGSVLASGDGASHVDVVNARDPAAPGAPTRIELPDDRSAAVDLDVTEDGSRLAAALGRKGMLVWRHTGEGTWTEVPVPGAAGSWVSGVRWSRDGSLLAAVTNDGRAVLWRVEGDELEPWAEEHVEGPRFFSADFAPDGSRLAVSGSNRTVYVYRLDEDGMELETQMEEFTSWVNDVRFSRDGTLLVAASSNRMVQAWPVTPDRIPTQPAYVIPVPSEAVEVREASEGRWLIVDSSGVLHRWTVAGRRLPDHEGIVFGSRFARDVPVLLTSAGVGDARARLWDVSDPAAPTPLAELRSPEGIGVPVGTSDISADGRFVLTGTVDGWTLVWDISDPREPRLVHRVDLAERGPDGDRVDDFVLGAMISEDGTWGVTFDNSGRLSVLRLGDTVTSTPQVSMARTPLALDAGADTFAVTWADEGVDVFAPDAPTTSLLSWPSDGQALDVRLAEDDTRLLVAGADQRVHVVDITDRAEPEVAQVLSGPGSTLNGLDVSPDGSRVAGAVIDGTVWTWTRQEDGTFTSEIAATLQPESVMAVGWSPTEPLLAVGGHRGMAGILLTDPEAAAAEICATRGDLLTEDEWRAALPDLPAQQPCPAPVEAGGTG